MMGGGAGRWQRLVMGAAAALLLSPPSLSSPPSSSATTDDTAGVVAVLALDESADAVAAEVRRLLSKSPPAGLQVLDDVKAQQRLSPPPGPQVDLGTAKATLQAADTAFNAIEHERSVAMLESLIEQLEKDAVFSVDKRDLLQTARLQCARRLMGIAGPTETGQAETKNGVRAKSHLQAALRLDPAIALDAQSAAPKLRALLKAAREAVAAEGHAAVAVKSTPAGATVYLDGRDLGQTPLTTPALVSPGRYRLWLEQGGHRSFTRVVDVDERPLTADIHVGVESALRPTGPGLSPPMVPFTPDDVAHLARRLGVEKLVVIADGHDEDGARTLTVFGRDGTVLHSAHATAQHPLQSAEQVLASFAGPVSLSWPPPAALYRAPVADPVGAASLTAVPSIAEAGPPWLAIGAGVGAAVVVGVATAAVLVLGSHDTVSVRIVEVR
jgi:hypothetical protein